MRDALAIGLLVWVEKAAGYAIGLLSDVERAVLLTAVMVVLGGVALIPFLWAGARESLDQRVFPNLSRKALNNLATVGYFALCLSAIEYLNPVLRTQPGVSERTVALTLQSEQPADSLGWAAEKPYLLRHRVFGKASEFTLQELLSLAAVILVVFHLIRTGRSWGSWLGRVRGSGALRTTGHYVPPTPTDLQSLRLGFNFGAMSLLVATVVAGLVRTAKTHSIVAEIPSALLLGLLLVSGPHCFVESVRLGAKVGRPAPLRLIGDVMAKVVLAGAVVYCAIALVSVVVQGVIPPHANSIITGVFLLLAACVVGFGSGSFLDLLDLFMFGAATLPLIRPIVTRLVPPAALDRTLLVAYVLATFLLHALFRRRQNKALGSSSVAFLKNMSWAPFVLGGAGRTKTSRIRFAGYGNDDELLEDEIGGKARVGGRPRVGGAVPRGISKVSLLARLDAWLRHLAGRFIGSRTQYEVMIVDIVTALRILEADYVRTGKTNHTIVAGVAVLEHHLFVFNDPPKQGPMRYCVPGSPYLQPNTSLRNFGKARWVRGVGQSSVRSDGWRAALAAGFANTEEIALPAHVMPEFAGVESDCLVVPPPFAYEIQLARGFRSDFLDRGELRYYVVVERNDRRLRGADRRAVTAKVLKWLERGAEEMRSEDTELPGGVVGARAVAVAISPEDGIGDEALDMRAHAIQLSALEIRFAADRVIEKDGDPRARQNYMRVSAAYESLVKERVLRHLPFSHVESAIDCRHVKGVRQARKKVFQGPFPLVVLHVVDKPGAIADVLGACGPGCSVRVVAARKGDGGVASGPVFVVASKAGDLQALRAAASNCAVTSSTIWCHAYRFAAGRIELAKVSDALRTQGVNLRGMYTVSCANNDLLMLCEFDPVDEVAVNAANALIMNSSAASVILPQQWQGIV